MACEQHEQQVGIARQRRPAPGSVRAFLLHSYVEAGRSGIFIMISSAPSLYRYAHRPSFVNTVPAWPSSGAGLHP